jgi:putative transposase
MIYPSYRRHRFSAEIMGRCLWSHFRFSQSCHDIEEMMAKRGIAVSCESAPLGVDLESRAPLRRRP